MTEIKLPPLPYPQIPGNDYTAKDMQDFARTAIEADRQEWDTRTSRSVEQLKESLLNRNQRFVATHSEVKNLIEYYEADRQAQGKPVAWVKQDIVENQFINMQPRRIWWECNEGIGIPIFTTPQPQQIPEPSPLRDSMSSNHRSYAEGWNACRAAMLAAAPQPEKAP